MSSSLYYLMAYFLIYAFLGWVMEVIFHAVVVGKIINRGFLNGPICPIYGVGMIGVLTLFTPLEEYPVLLYGGSILFATLVELIGGYVLLKLFHLRWWDYSDEPFNLGGFICLRFSIAWGICIVFVLKIIHPVIQLNVKILDHLPGYILIAVCYIVLAADLVITVLSIMNLNKDLKRLNALGAEIRKSSDSLTDRIGQASMDVGVRVQEGRVQAALAKAEGRDKLEELKGKADQMSDQFKGMAGEMTGQLRDKAGEMTDQFRDKAGEMTDQFRDKTGAVTDQMKERAEVIVTRMLKHPRLQRFFGYERLRRAFPKMKHETYQAELKSVMDTLRTRTSTISSLFSRKEEKKD